MNLKKISGALAAVFAAGALLSGCGGDTEPAPAADLKIGVIRHLNATETLMDELIRDAEQKAGIKLATHKTVFYDSLPMLQMGLESGSVSEASTYDCVARYLIARNPNYEIVADHNPIQLSDNFAFAMRANDADLISAVNAAIASMKADGVLDEITKTYITDLQGADDPPAVAIEMFDDAEPLNIGVTGDLPPLDLVLANGEIAGFNTAMLAELGRRLHRNIQIVQIDSASRAAALTAGQIDVSFWAIVPVGDDLPADLDTPEGVTLSAPYFKDQIVHVSLKK